MDRNARNVLHQRRSSIGRRSRTSQAVEFFNVLTSPALLATTEALLPASNAGVDPRALSFKHTVQLWTEWVCRGLSAMRDDGRLFTLIAQCRVGKRPGRIEPRMRKRRPKPYPWLQIPRVQARRKTQRHGHAWETK